MSVPNANGPSPGAVKLRKVSLTPLVFTMEDVAMVCVVWVPCPSTADGMSAYCDSFYYEAAKTPAARSQEVSPLQVLVQAPVTATRGRCLYTD